MLQWTSGQRLTTQPERGNKDKGRRKCFLILLFHTMFTPKSCFCVDERVNDCMFAFVCPCVCLCVCVDNPCKGKDLLATKTPVSIEGR